MHTNQELIRTLTHVHLDSSLIFPVIAPATGLHIVYNIKRGFPPLIPGIVIMWCLSKTVITLPMGL